MDEAQLELQQSAYKVAGVDESAPAVERKKRKADHEEVCIPSTSALRYCAGW